MKLDYSIRAEALLARLEGAREKLQDNLRVVVQRLSIKAQGKVKSGKLTGQVLHVRTGTLRRSINQQLVERQGGVFGRVGTNVKYARPHEYGFEGSVNVRSHARTLRTGTVQDVRAHVRNVRFPERSFLRSTLGEMEPEIERDIRKTVLATLKVRE